MTILVGTCSWTDKTLIESGNFYPEDVKTPEARLKFYASKFPICRMGGDESRCGDDSASWRNHGTWEKKGLKAASDRFDYWYDKKELKELAPKIEALKAKKVHVLFNVNNQDQGQKGAAMLQSLF